MLGRVLGVVEPRSSPVGDAIRARRRPVGVSDPDAAVRHAAVFASVRIISESIAAMPWHVYRSRGDVREKLARQPEWVDAPTQSHTPFEFRRDLLAALLLRGNAFVWVEQVGSDGWPTKLDLVHPARVVLTNDGGWLVDSEPVRDVHDGGRLLHIPALRVADSRLGVSPLTAVAMSVAAGLDAEQLGRGWFAGSPPMSVLRSDRELSDDQARRLQARWVAARESAGAFPAVLSGGVRWEPVTITPADAAFIDAQRFSVSQVARAFGVPPHLVGDVERSTSWGAGIEAQSIGFLRHTLQPWIELVDQRMSMLVPRGQFVRTTTAGLLRADIGARYLAYQRALFARFMTKNEVRALEDLPPIEGGDDVDAPIGTMKVE